MSFCNIRQKINQTLVVKNFLYVQAGSDLDHKWKGVNYFSVIRGTRFYTCKIGPYSSQTQILIMAETKFMKDLHNCSMLHILWVQLLFVIAVRMQNALKVVQNVSNTLHTSSTSLNFLFLPSFQV